MEYSHIIENQKIPLLENDFLFVLGRERGGFKKLGEESLC